jgi:DNA mismatch repair protein MLH3
MCEEACSDGFENFTAQISKWRDDSDQHTVEHALKFEILTHMTSLWPSYYAHILYLLFYYLLLQALELPHVSSKCYDDVLSISSGPLNLSCSSLVPECIDKNCFEEARVLLQLDKKFIPVISGKLLLLVDQVCS